MDKTIDIDKLALNAIEKKAYDCTNYPDWSHDEDNYRILKTEIN